MTDNEVSATFFYSLHIPPGKNTGQPRWDCYLKDRHGLVVAHGWSNSRAGSLQMAALSWGEGFEPWETMPLAEREQYNEPPAEGLEMGHQ